MQKIITKIQSVAKLVVAVLTAIVTAGVGLIPEKWIGYVQIGIVVVGLIAIYRVPNKSADVPAAVAAAIGDAKTVQAAVTK